jgi:ATP-dependent RNA helicase DeaD
MKTFTESNLKSEILSAIKDLGFEQPTPIQEKSITHFLESKSDLVALAQTGTGKTAAFGLPLLHEVELKEKSTQTLILCPTRELCLQIANDINSFSKYMKGFRVSAVYGGANIETQIRELSKGAHFIVGTPGRTVDLIKRRKINVTSIKNLVLDEADEMLSMGFKDDLDFILSQTPEEKRTLLYSATMPAEIAKMSKRYMQDATQISVVDKNKTTSNVTHEYYVCLAKDRYEALKRVVDVNPDIYGIVFCRTRRETKEVAEKLFKDGYNSDVTHGDLSQAQRDLVMQKFREKRIQILVATDVAARGIDVNDLTHVINYNLPDEIETYVHRSGRTGRAHSKGISISILNTRETSKVRQIERKIGKSMELKQIPNGEEICEKQLFKLIKEIENIKVDEDQIEKYLSKIYTELENFTREDLIKKIVSVEFNRFLSYYKGRKDINAKSDRKSRDEKSGKGRDRDRAVNSNNDFIRYHINIGKKDNLNPKKLLELINQNIDKREVEIGHIDLYGTFSFFEVDKEFGQHVQDSLAGVNYKGIKVKVEIPKPKKNDGRGKRRDRDFKGKDRGRDFKRDRGDRSKDRGKDFHRDKRRTNKDRRK